ncbi:MAG: DnaJ domain-containing protein [Actinomycetota bacterium]
MDGRRARALLGVTRHAGREEIRRAFRARALATHPDRGGDRTLFELTVLAYESLRPVEVRPAPRRTPDPLPGAPPRFSAYDSAPRAAPRRDFGDVLRAAILRQQLAG